MKTRNATSLQHLQIKNLFMLSVRISSYGCTREVWRARKMRKSSTRPASYPDVSLDVSAKEGGEETTGETSGRSCFQDGGKSNGGPIYNF